MEGINPPPDEGSVDLSREIPSGVEQQSSPTPPSTGSVPYDPERDREAMRGKIALWLLCMLAGVLLLAFISIWLKNLIGMDIEMLRTVLTIIFGPLVTLVSAATGFYYGSRSSSR